MRWRPIAAGALTLIALQVLLSGAGPEAGGNLLGWISTGLRSAMAADVAGLPYTARAAGGTSKGSGSTGSGSTGSGTSGTPASGPNGLPTNPSVVTT